MGYSTKVMCPQCEGPMNKSADICGLCIKDNLRERDQVIQEYYDMGFTLNEISQEIDIPQSTVSTRLSKMREKGLIGRRYKHYVYEK